MTTKLFSALRDPTELDRLAGIGEASPTWGAVHRLAYGSPLRPGDEALLRDVLPRRRGFIAGLRDAFGADEALPQGPFRGIAARVGRRGRKTSGLIAPSALFHALCVPSHDAEAQPGEVLLFAIVCPVTRQGTIAARAVVQRLEALRAKKRVDFVTRESGDRVEIEITEPATRCRHVIAVVPSNPSHLRGAAVPFAAIDEAAFFGDEYGQSSLRDVVAALGPSALQFSRSMLVVASTPGRSGDLFQTLTQEQRPGTLVVAGPTWTFNPSISREQCWAASEREAVGNPKKHFAQEFEASRFGNASEDNLADEGLIRACVELVPDRQRGFHHCNAAVGLDVGLVRDSTAICAATRELIFESETSQPVSRIVIEHVEEHRGRPGAPLELSRMLDRAAAVAKGYGRSADSPATIYCDAHMSPEVVRGSRERGVRAVQLPMSNTAQADRWTLLAQLIRGNRLDLPDHGELIRQLGSLRVTQLANGQTKVEARRDDLADAVALAVQQASLLSPSESRSEVVITRGRSGNRVWNRRLQNGDLQPVLPPLNTHEWFDLVQRLDVEGGTTPEIERWKAATPNWRELVYAKRLNPAQLGMMIGSR